MCSSAPVAPSHSVRAQAFRLHCEDLRNLASLPLFEGPRKAANSSDKLLSPFKTFVAASSQKSVRTVDEILGLADKIPEILGKDICFLLSTFQ